MPFKLLMTAGCSQGEAFICGEPSHFRVVKTGKQTSWRLMRKPAVEDGKQHQYVILRGNLSQSTSGSFPNPFQSTCICSSLTEHQRSSPRTMFLTVQRTVCSHTRRTGICKGLSMVMDCLERQLVRSQPPISSV